MNLSRMATAVATIAALTLAACGESNRDPQLAMCQSVAKQLTGNSIAEWGDTSQNDRTRYRQVAIDYSTVGDDSGSISCSFDIDERGTVATGPSTVRLNGEEVDRKTLLSASFEASKELIAGTAAETADRARALANEAGDKARDVAGDAVGKAVEAGQALQQRLEQ